MYSREAYSQPRVEDAEVGEEILQPNAEEQPNLAPIEDVPEKSHDVKEHTAEIALQKYGDLNSLREPDVKQEEMKEQSCSEMSSVRGTSWK